MRKIITHKSCDLDAITSVWLLKRFMPGWEEAEIAFVNAGEKLTGEYTSSHPEGTEGFQAIEIIDGIPTIHVDTGLGALDHHQTGDNNICGASLTLDFVLKNQESTLNKHENKRDAVKRIVELVIDDDHFQEVYYPESDADVYEAGIVGIIQGYKILHKGDDLALVEFCFEILDDILHNLEAKLWAESEIKEKGVEFQSKWGKAIGVETINDEVLKRAQMMGYKVSVRKDPSVGFVRIKAMPDKRRPSTPVILSDNEESRSFTKVQDDDFALGIDLTETYEKLKSMDPESSWFLHASKRMLLNGSSKNPEMKGSNLTLEQVVETLKG